MTNLVKVSLWVALLMGTVSFSLAQSSNSRRPSFAIPGWAVELAPGVFDLGEARDVSGRRVQGVAFVHPRRGYGHKPGHGEKGQGQDKGKKGDANPTCFSLMASGAKWKTAEPYVLDSTNNDGLDPVTVKGWVEASLLTWEMAAGPQIFGAEDPSGAVDGADTEAPDGQNEVLFGSISNPGTIAVTIVWGIFKGPPFGRELVEWDAVFDDEYNWGSAGPTDETSLGDETIMDFLNIAVHEFGHALGLDHPEDTCVEESMFAFAEEGETKKRTLAPGDVAGVQELY